MDAPAAGDALQEGRQALERADWAAALAAFKSALDTDATPDARDGLGQALWFLGDVADAVAERERAFEAYARAGRCDEAARIAVWVSHQHMLAGRPSAGRGWLARSERALEAAAPGCAGHGWVAIERARQAEGAAEQVEHARRALEISRAAGAADLEVFALSLLGRATVRAGRRDDGMTLLEEAMAAAMAGRARDVHTLAEAYCNLILACAQTGELEQAAEWCELVDEFARAHAAAPLLASCRTVHADVLVARGCWREAERALEDALATHERHIPQMGAPTVASLADLRVLQGRLDEAEALLEGREEHPSSLRALALLRIAQGRPGLAVGLLERGLRATEDDVIRATRLLAPLVDALLACDDVDRATAAAGELRRLARLSGIRLAAARADGAAARVALAHGKDRQAAEAARRALAGFGTLLMPLEVAQARVDLARALAAHDPEAAADEARCAFTALRELGAARAMDEAAGVLRELGGATGGRARTAGELTSREEQVLKLLAVGMSNARIARTLVISEKTAGHHVSHILAKLGAHNRTEAVAVAARRRTPA